MTMIALVLALVLLTDVPPVIGCIDPAEETLILFYPDRPICPEHMTSSQRENI